MQKLEGAFFKNNFLSYGETREDGGRIAPEGPTCILLPKTDTLHTLRKMKCSPVRVFIDLNNTEMERLPNGTVWCGALQNSTGFLRIFQLYINFNSFLGEVEQIYPFKAYFLNGTPYVKPTLH